MKFLSLATVTTFLILLSVEARLITKSKTKRQQRVQRDCLSSPFFGPGEGPSPPVLDQVLIRTTNRCRDASKDLGLTSCSPKFDALTDFQAAFFEKKPSDQDATKQSYIDYCCKEGGECNPPK